jgi:hypothetical protein
MPAVLGAMEFFGWWRANYSRPKYFGKSRTDASFMSTYGLQRVLALTHTVFMCNARAVFRLLSVSSTMTQRRGFSRS